MGGLRHLQLFGNKLTNDGLRNILDSCPHLCSLDLRHCFILNLDGDLGRVCAERIEKLWLPHDSIEGKEFVARSEGYCFKWTVLPDKYYKINTVTAGSGRDPGYCSESVLKVVLHLQGPIDVAHHRHAQ
ncbi:hypothetical protein ABKV19_019830 [Rosa sericea]